MLTWGLPMLTSQIIFKFDGREADRHRLDPSDYIDHEIAGRQLLALHAYFRVMGKVPNGGILSRGPGYNVYVAGRRQGSLEGAWIVEFLAKEALKAGVIYGAKKALAYTYEHLLKDSIGPILARKRSSMPMELRREPIFEPLDRSNEPFIDVDRERAFHWGQLRERSTAILVSAARPVGRSADTLMILAANDNAPIGIIDEAALRRLREDAQAYRELQITSALNDLGLRGPHGTA
jgi:hypothetical protein